MSKTARRSGNRKPNERKSKKNYIFFLKIKIEKKKFISHNSVENLGTRYFTRIHVA